LIAQKNVFDVLNATQNPSSLQSTISEKNKNKTSKIVTFDQILRFLTLFAGNSGTLQRAQFFLHCIQFIKTHLLSYQNQQ
jgi:hypothetical protein